MSDRFPSSEDYKRMYTETPASGYWGGLFGGVVDPINPFLSESSKERNRIARQKAEKEKREIQFMRANEGKTQAQVMGDQLQSDLDFERERNKMTQELIKTMTPEYATADEMIAMSKDKSQFDFDLKSKFQTMQNQHALTAMSMQNRGALDVQRLANEGRLDQQQLIGEQQMASQLSEQDWRSGENKLDREQAQTFKSMDDRLARRGQTLDMLNRGRTRTAMDMNFRRSRF